MLGGIAHLGRFIDKIRLRHAGQIQDYNYITVGFDKYLVDFLQIDPKLFEQLVLTGRTDEELARLGEGQQSKTVRPGNCAMDPSAPCLRAER